MSPDTPRRHGAEASLLGQAVAYRDTYAPELLFPIERQLKRDELGIAAGALPFVGEDLWNAYELSWLDARGKPVVALGEFRVPATSPRLIESKSLKLYLNAFNQQRMASVDEVQSRIAADLSAAAGAEVGVVLMPLATRPQRRSAYPQGDCLDALDIAIDTYQPAPELLHAPGAEVEETLYSHLRQIDVKVGQDVKKGDILGKTGVTGLAVGDHLHFGVLVGGREASPIEWWDQHWIDVTIKNALHGQ